MGHEFSAYLREHGIEREASIPMSPQQNGQAERWQQTIVSKAEAMRHGAGLSSGFWKLAVEAANHIYNRQPLRRVNWKTPIELWNGTIPDVSYLQVFGCLAYVHIQKERRGEKLGEKAQPMIFVGYETGSKGYWFWDKSTRSIVLSRDVAFDETSFPNKPSDIPPVPPPAPVAPILPIDDLPGLLADDNDDSQEPAAVAPPAGPVPFPVIPQPVGADPPDHPVPAALHVLRPRAVAPAPIVRP